MHAETWKGKEKRGRHTERKTNQDQESQITSQDWGEFQQSDKRQIALQRNPPWLGCEVGDLDHWRIIFVLTSIYTHYQDSTEKRGTTCICVCWNKEYTWYTGTTSSIMARELLKVKSLKIRIISLLIKMTGKEEEERRTENKRSAGEGSEWGREETVSASAIVIIRRG